MNLLKQWTEFWRRRRVRRELLDTPGVDLLVQRVMDAKYGKHGWRVSFEERTDLLILEALVTPEGSSQPIWGMIGPLESLETRAWLRAGGRPPEVSHAKLAPYKIEPPLSHEGVAEEGYYFHSYADTQPPEKS